MQQFSTRFIPVSSFTLWGIIGAWLGICPLQAVWAQKTLFSIPTAEITEQRQLFFQQQVNVADHVQANTTFTYGFGHHLEAGLSLGNLTFDARPHHHLIELDSPEPAENPHLIINVQRGFDLTKWLKLGIGTRTGVAHRSSDTAGHIAQYKLASFSFVTTQLRIPGTQITFNAGSYHVNQAFGGPGTNVGYLLGADIPLVKDKLNFQGDYVSGTSSISLLTLGLGLILPKEWQLGVGVQMPSPGSDNPVGIAIQLSSP